MIKTATKLMIVLIGVGSAAFAPAQTGSVTGSDILKEPRMSVRSPAKMLIVEAKGDPNVVGPKAFGLLFQLYFTMKDTPKGPTLSPPRARWPLSLDTPKSEWIGFYGLPVPETVSELPQHKAPEGLKASLTTWEYGEVVEILYVGPYDKEEPTLKRLKDFVKQQGYEVLEGHEEEYLKGPTMSGPGDPDKYVTIIRYRVRRNSKK